MPSRIRRGTSPRRARMAICPRRRRSGTTAGRPGRTRITAGPRRRTAIPTRRSISAPTIAASWSPSRAHYGFRVVDAFSRIVRLGEGLGPRQPPQRRRRSSAPSRRCASAATRWQHRDVDPGAARRHRGLPARRQRRRLHRPRPARARPRARGRRPAHRGLSRRHRLRVARRSAAPHSVIVFDIGGGSTEIAWLDGTGASPLADPCKRIRAWDSLPVGVVTLAERHGGVDVTPDERSRAWSRRCRDLLRRFRARGRAGRACAQHFHLLGTSGTVTTVGGIHLGLPRYDRRRVDGMWMRDGDVIAASSTACSTSTSTSARPIPASAASAPTSCSPAAPSSRRSGGRSRRTACASPIAACARAS